MKNVLVFAVCGICVLQVIGAATTIDELRAKRKQVGDFTSNQITETMSIIAESITSTLNSRADDIMKEIKISPQKCHVWLKEIEFIKSKFTKPSKTCNLTSRLGNRDGYYRSQFQSFDKNLKKVAAACNPIVSTCQNKFEKLDRTLNSIQLGIIEDTNEIKRVSKICEDEIGGDLNKSLDSAYASFKKCK